MSLFHQLPVSWVRSAGRFARCDRSLQPASDSGREGEALPTAGGSDGHCVWSGVGFTPARGSQRGTDWNGLMIVGMAARSYEWWAGGKSFVVVLGESREILI